MNDLKTAIQTINRYNEMPFYDFVKEFGEYSGQYIPMEAKLSWVRSNRPNVEFATSDYLSKFELKNLMEI